LVVGVVRRIVAHIEVVHALADILGFLGLVGDCDALGTFRGLLQFFDRHFGVFGIVIGDVAKAFGKVTFIHGNLDGFGGSLLFLVEVAEHRVKLASLHLFWNISYENAALSIGGFQVCSEQRLVEWQTSTLFTLNFKVSQHLASLFEFFVILKRDKSRVEGLGGVSVNLRCDVQVDLRCFQDVRQLAGRELDLWEVI